MLAIKTEGLSKYFNAKKAVDDLNLEVPEGVIFGYLGPNGAGKTTTIRLLLSLAKPTKGNAYILGENIRETRSYLSKIGFLPEVPSFYNFFNAREFLHFIADISGMTKPDQKIEEVLETVDLQKERKRIGTYSRGMKQRLGIAQAMLSDPPLLILDEPTSSLDPEGRKETLDLITSFKGRKTVFFSTHILGDVERICDMVGIIKEGRLMLSDSIENIKKSHSKRTLLIEVDKPKKLMEILQYLNWVESMSSLNNNGIMLEVKDLPTAQKELPQIITKEKILLNKWELMEPTLEDIFLKVVHNGN
jgi:ABC-2 type transport system ATP-binding protein